MRKSGIVTVITALIFVLVLLSITFCRKDKPVNTKVNLYLSDAPAYFKAVNIDIQKILVKYDGSGNEQEVKLNHPGVYNLLDFSNGYDTLLGSITVPPGKISQIHIMFGQNNSFVNDSENVTLNLAPEIENGMIISTDQKVTEEKIFNLWIDFDASRSVISSGNRNYSLRPVVRVFSEDVKGGIRGVVIPEDRKPFVYAISGSDSIGTITDSKGRFYIKGVAGGIYKMRFIPQKPGVQQAVIDSVEVKEDSLKYIGTIVIN